MIEILELDKEYIPLNLRRAEKENLQPNLTKYQSQLQEIFNAPIEISYDLRRIYDKLNEKLDTMENRRLKQDGVLDTEIPTELDRYFSYAIIRLKNLNFKQDDLYRTEFLKQASKGILFEVVDALDTVRLL